MAISIEIKDEATPVVARLQEGLEAGKYRRIIGRAVANLISDHLFSLDQSRPNQIGGRRTHFWSQAARGTNYQVQPDGVIVSVNQVGIRQRWQGGFIRPVNRKYLTIPAVPEAHGKRASEFSNLRFGFSENKFGNLQPALVEASASRIKFVRSKDGFKLRKVGASGGRAIFWLVRQAFQRADPTVLPTEQEIGAAAVGAATQFVQNVIDRKKPDEA